MTKRVALKVLAEVTLGKMLQASREGEQLHPYLKASTVTEAGLELRGLQEMAFTAREREQLRLLKGDVVVVEGGSIGRSAILRAELSGVYFQNSINRVRAREDADGRYLNYAIIQLREAGYFDAVTNQATIRHLTTQKLSNSPVALWNGRRQREIADYLDHETAEIDAFVADLNDAARLARERLVKRRDSLVWSGGYPRVRIKHLANVQAGHPYRSEDFRAGPIGLERARLLRGVNVGVGRIDWSNMVTTARNIVAETPSMALVAGDLVLGLDRPVICAGVRVALLNEEAEGSYLVQRVARIRARRGVVSNEWLAMGLSGRQFASYLEPLFTGVSVPHVSPSQLLDFRVPVPSVDEQSRTLVSVEQLASAEASAQMELARAKALANERRAALITAAVTGQIDVTAKRRSAVDDIQTAIEESR